MIGALLPMYVRFLILIFCQWPSVRQRGCTAVVLQALSVNLSMHKKLSKAVSGWTKSNKKKSSCQAHQKQCQLNVGCWNMRTLVEAEGPIETSVLRPSDRAVMVDWKASMKVCKLKKYKVNAVGISETKWFGQAIYQVEGYTILHSGRPVPDASPFLRNEGVGIVFDPALATAWKEAGEEWKAVSSRIIKARLKVVSKQLSGRNTPIFLTMVSVYAPTFRAPEVEKERFYSDLQVTLDEVNEQDLLLVVGDFNARVGSMERGNSEDAWIGVRGAHGVGWINEAGSDLLSFCALNELSIMNTCFEKKNIYKYTWQHHGSKHWHCIDYIIMRQRQRRLCQDVAVIHSADCWTNHKLLCAKIRVKVSYKSPA